MTKTNDSKTYKIQHFITFFQLRFIHLENSLLIMRTAFDNIVILDLDNSSIFIFVGLQQFI